MYGCRDAGQNFELFTREVMVDRLGFECGVWSPCLYVHARRDLVAYIYGDNFVCKGTRESNLEFFNDLKAHTWAKNEDILGPLQSAGDVRECVCLNRIFRWSPDNAIELEADPRRVQIILSQLGLEASSTKSVVSQV